MRRPISPGNVISPSGAILFFAATLILLYYVASALQARDVVLGFLITEWVLLLIPSALVPLFRRFDLRRTFSLRLPGIRGFVGTLLVSVSVWILGVLGTAAMELVLPGTRDFAESMEEFFNIATEGLSGPGVLFLFAVSPAICEEVAFRGIILSGLAGRLPKWQTVLVVGLLFGAFHLSIYRFVPTALLGMVITYAVIQTRSIVSGMIIHFGVNSIAFSSGIYPSIGALFGLHEGRIENWSNVAGFGALLVVGLWMLWREKR